MPCYDFSDSVLVIVLVIVAVSTEALLELLSNLKLHEQSQ